MKIKLKLHWQIFIGIVAGLLFGFFFTEHVKYASWIGVLFLRALQMIIMPLVLSSIVAGVANIGSGGSLGRIGLKTMAYFVLTTLFAILIGLFLVNFIQPGVGANLTPEKTTEQLTIAEKAITSSESFWDTLINIIPTNIFDSLSRGDLIAIIFFAIFFGAIITKLENAKHRTFLLDLSNSVSEAMMKITMMIIKFAPLGIFGLIANVVKVQLGEIDLSATLSQKLDVIIPIFERLGLFVLTAFAGLFIHSFITLPLILKIFGRVNPWKHYSNMATPLLTAFSTSSSSATLPLSMEAVEHKNGVSNKIASFVLPLGATVNMNGTALFECVGALFIAQAYGIELSLGAQIITVTISLLAAIGAPGVPMAGLVMMTVVLKAVGLPLEGVGLILAVERLIDMPRTAVNVLGDTCGAVIIAKSEGEKLKI